MPLLLVRAKLDEVAKQTLERRSTTIRTGPTCAESGLQAFGRPIDRVPARLQAVLRQRDLVHYLAIGKVEERAIGPISGNTSGASDRLAHLIPGLSAMVECTIRDPNASAKPVPVGETCGNRKMGSHNATAIEPFALPTSRCYMRLNSC